MKCAACGNDVSHYRSFETTDKSLCPKCHDAGDIWAAQQARTPDPRSQVEKLTPKAGDLIVLRVPADCAQPSEASMAKFADAFPGVRFLFLPIAEEPYSFTEQLGELRHTVTFKTHAELTYYLEGRGLASHEVELKADAGPLDEAWQAAARAVNHAAIQAATAKVAGTSPQVASSSFIEELKAMSPEQLRAGVQKMIQDASVDAPTAQGAAMSDAYWDWVGPPPTAEQLERMRREQEQTKAALRSGHLPETLFGLPVVIVDEE